MLERFLSGMLLFMTMVLVVLLQSMEAQQDFQCPPTPDTQVLILGAGIAGISAAQTLYENGIEDFIIIEGKDKIGGRMRHEKIGGITVNLGAYAITGVDESGESNKVNPVWVLKEKCGLNSSLADYDDDVYYNKQGNIIDEEFRWDDYYYANEQVQNMSFRMPTLPEGVLQHEIEVTRGDISVQDAFALAGWIPVTEGDAMVQFFEYEWDLAAKPSSGGLKLHKVEYQSLDGGYGDQEHFVIDERGYDFIVQCIADEFLKESDPRLLLNSTIKKINWKDECVCVEIEQGNVSSKTLCGAYAIVTFSFGVLQDAVQSKTPFVNIWPSFPQWKLDAFQLANMVDYLTLYAEFEYKFWDDHEYIGRAAFKPNETQYWPMFQSLGLSNGKFSSDIPVDTPILMATVIEEESIRLSKLSKEQIIEELMGVLKEMYGQDIPYPKQLVSKNWRNDPFFRGTWMDLDVGADSGTIEVIRAPLGAMHFSGEHTSLRYPGYTHGAYLEGQRVAHQVARLIQT